MPDQIAIPEPALGLPGARGGACNSGRRITINRKIQILKDLVQILVTVRSVGLTATLIFLGVTVNHGDGLIRPRSHRPAR